MIDLNDPKKLKNLQDILKTEGGRYLMEYLESKIEPDFVPDTSKSFSEIGMDSVVCYNVNKRLKDILRFFNSQL